jgi:hypothetical protein
VAVAAAVAVVVVARVVAVLEPGAPVVVVVRLRIHP